MDVRGDFLGPPHCTTTRTLIIKEIEKLLSSPEPLGSQGTL